jgi:uncharacterized protein
MSAHRHALTPTIPLKGSRAGVQYAGWQPRSAAMDGLGNRVLAGQRVPVAGDVTLNADVYTPQTAGRYPAVVSFAAYSTERHTAGIPTGSNEVGSPPIFTDRGYCPVIVERRGMGRSGGEQSMFFSEQDVDDHEAVIAWAAEQPWCNGEVVLFGTSYYGMTQPLVARRRPPHLKAFFANELCTDFFGHLAQFGGVPALYFFNIWMGANFTQENVDFRMSPGKRAAISRLTNGAAHGLVERALHARVETMFGKFMNETPVEVIRRIYANWLFDQKTRADATIPEGSSRWLSQIEVPFVAVQNLSYFNLHQYGSYELFERASTPADRKWLVLGAPSYELPVYSWQGEAIAFFDHVLRGSDNGYAEQPPVRYWVDGAERFETAATFPPADADPLRLELSSAGGDHATHALVRDGAEPGANSWAAVPIGLPVLGGLDEVANQTLAFEFPVEDELLLAGPVTLNLSFSSNEIDSYIVARLTRVDTAGTLHHLSMEAVRPAARGIDRTRGSAVEIVLDTGTRVPLVPGEPVELRFSLTPGPVQLRPGERLRLDLGSRTDLLRKGPGDSYAQFDLPVPPYLSRNTAHFGGASWLEVTQIPVPR